MITWMQKHKKYLIITIWISTIAFIAAGMVGWGAYNFSSSAGSVAKVGRISVTNDDLNAEYNAIFRAYSAQFEEINGKPLDVEQAKELGFDKLALKRAINKALLENYALDLGLRVSDEEVMKEIESTTNFQLNGTFNNGLYKQTLKQNRIKPLDYENGVKKDLLIQKILAAFPVTHTPSEESVLSLSLNLADRLAIHIIDENQVKVEINDALLREYYEKNKESYRSKKSFEVESARFDIAKVSPTADDIKKYYDENKENYKDFEANKDEITNDYKKYRANRDALEAYVALKQNKSVGANEIFKEGEINDVIFNALDSAKDGEAIQPFEVGDTIWAIKLKKKIQPNILDFESVKNRVKNDFYPLALRDSLKKEAESKINVFRGNDIGFFSLNDMRQIAGLSQIESLQLLQNIFGSGTKNGFVLLGNKAVLYKILEQKVLNNKQNADIFGGFKSVILEQTMFDFLAKEYKVTQYVKEL